MATRASQFRKVGSALVEHRTAPRHRVMVSRASTKRGNAAAREAVLHDLSIYGCRIAISGGQDVGEQWLMRFEGDTAVSATVVWSEGGFAGCRFEKPIARALVRALTLVIC